MSENLIHESVARQIADLALLADSDCENFQHQVIDSKVTFAGPGEQNVLQVEIAENSALVITNVDIKVLYDTADPLLLGGDFRSSFDLNPWGPFVGIGSVGEIRFLVNDQQPFATAFDIGVINQGILFVISGGKIFKIAVDPKQPAAKSLVLVTRVNTFIVPEAAAVELKKKETRIVTQ